MMLKYSLLSAASLSAASALDTCARSCYFGSPMGIAYPYPQESGNSGFCQDARGVCQFPQAVTTGYQPDDAFDCPTDCEFKTPEGNCWENPRSDQLPLNGKCFCMRPDVYDFCAPVEAKVEAPCAQSCWFGSPAGWAGGQPAPVTGLMGNSGYCQESIGICQFPQAHTAGYPPSDDSFDCPTDCDFKAANGECWENPGSGELPVNGKCFCKLPEVYEYCEAASGRVDWNCPSKVTKMALAEENWECSNSHMDTSCLAGATLKMCPEDLPVCSGYEAFQSYGTCGTPTIPGLECTPTTLGDSMPDVTDEWCMENCFDGEGVVAPACDPASGFYVCECTGGKAVL